MDPNVKLMFDELSKQIHAEIKDVFVVHKAAFTKRFEDVAAAKQIHDSHITNLDTTVMFDKTFA
jgi:hypothetical protein